MNKKTVRDIDISHKRVLIRVDFNVPVDINTGKITDDSRIRAALPTIRYCLDKNAKIILMSHRGRPKGKVVDDQKMAPVAGRLSELLDKPVQVTDDCIGPEVEQAVRQLQPGDVLMLENLRFHKEEEAGDDGFAARLAKLGDVYVNDAFGTSHRAHASISEIAKYLPAVAGFLLEKEINTLGGLLEKPERPFTAVLGGAKVSDKVAIITNFLGKVNNLLIGGGMAATFLKAQGIQIGTSIVEEDLIETAKSLIAQARQNGVNLILPDDVIVTVEIKEGAEASAVMVDAVPADKKIADIGAKTTEKYADILRRSKTVFWNGPMGVVEIDAFASGTRTLAETMAEIDATTILGGGSTAETIENLGLADKVTFVSTGGGASMEFLGGDVLPGVAALMDK